MFPQMVARSYETIWVLRLSLVEYVREASSTAQVAYVSLCIFLVLGLIDLWVFFSIDVEVHRFVFAIYLTWLHPNCKVAVCVLSFRLDRTCALPQSYREPDVTLMITLK